MSNDFIKQKQAAVQVMREMNARASKNNDNQDTNNFNAEQKNTHPKKANQKQNTDNGFSLTNLLKDSDTSLILGLLLILFSENADKRLLFALIYILL